MSARILDLGLTTALILLGLAILSQEFERPRIWLAHLKQRGVTLKQRIAARRSDPGK